MKLSDSIIANSPIYAHLFSSSLTLDAAQSKPGRLVFNLALEPQHLNSRGVLHGAVSATLLDFISGPVIASCAAKSGADVQSVHSAKRGVSTDISLQYLSAVGVKEGDRIVVVGRCKKLGGKLAWVGMEVRVLGASTTDVEQGKLCVEGSHTKYVG